MAERDNAVDVVDHRQARYKEMAYSRFTIQPDDVFVFLVTYGRYESSAKALGWVDQLKDGEELRVCVKKVADAVKEGFERLVGAEPALLAAVRYFYKTPPLRQVWGHDQAEWRAVPRSETGMLRTLLDLAQARNNLFHGGKGWSELECRDRDRAVVAHGLTILCAIIASNADLTEKFEAY